MPGYLAYLWQEGRMSLRTAALYGRDPAGLRTAAETLVLRGVHPTVEAAETALIAVRDTPLPPRPEQRRPLRTWVRSVLALLVFGGFISPSGERRTGIRARLRDAVALLAAGVLWAITWIFPLTFMIAMSWACESHARQLGLRTMALYEGDPAIRVRHDPGHDRRQVVRSIALALSVGVPIAFVAYVNHVRQTVGLNWLGAIGALVALSIVVAAAVAGSRR